MPDCKPLVIGPEQGAIPMKWQIGKSPYLYTLLVPGKDGGIPAVSSFCIVAEHIIRNENGLKAGLYIFSLI